MKYQSYFLINYYSRLLSLTILESLLIGLGPPSEHMPQLNYNLKINYIFNSIDKENSAINHRNISIATSDSELNRSMSIYEPRISHGLLDFIAMLWLIHGKTLQKEENGDFLEKLYNHAEKCLPIILRYFKVKYYLLNICFFEFLSSLVGI